MIRSILAQYGRSFEILFALVVFSAGFSARAQTAADLVANLNAASPGDTIIVPAGDYGRVDLGPYNFSPAVSLQFEDGAVIQTLRITDVVGVTFEKLTISAGVSFDPVREVAVLVQRGGDVTFRDSSFSWAKDSDPLNDGTSLIFDGVDGLRVENSHFSDMRDGLIVKDSSDVEIWGSHFTDLLKDGIIISGSENVVIRENACTDFQRVEGLNTHPDCIQIQASSRGIADTNVLIADNVSLIQDGERAQGIFVYSRFAGVPHRQITIENNLIRQAHHLGIYAENVEDLIIRGNDILPSFDSADTARILVRDPSSNVLIEGNTAPLIRAPAHATVQNNTILE